MAMFRRIAASFRQVMAMFSRITAVFRWNMAWFRLIWAVFFERFQQYSGQFGRIRKIHKPAGYRVFLPRARFLGGRGRADDWDENAAEGWKRQRLTNAEVAAYYNAEVLGCQAESTELDRTILLPTPSPSGNLGRRAALSPEPALVCCAK